MTNTRQSNTKIIRAINEKLKTVSIKKVAARLNRSHNSLYFYLDVTRAEKANLPMLKQISLAIAEVEKQEALESKKILQSLTK